VDLLHGVSPLNWLATQENQIRGFPEAGHVTALFADN